jgi:hypothetical protein
MQGGSRTYFNFSYAEPGNGILTIAGSNTFSSFTIANQPKFVNFTAGTTQTINGASNAFAATTATTTLRSTAASAYTINASSTNLSNVDVQYSTAGGAASPFQCTACVNSGNNTNWTFL